MSDPGNRPSKAVQRLNEIYLDENGKEKDAALLRKDIEALLRDSADPNTKAAQNAPETILRHLKGVVPPVPHYLMETVARSLGLNFSRGNVNKPSSLTTGDGAIISYKEDRFGSIKQAMEAACVIFIRELDKSCMINTSFTLHSRMNAIDGAEIYGINSYVKYIAKCNDGAKADFLRIPEGKIIDEATGEVDLTPLKPGGHFIVTDLEATKVRMVLVHCQKNGVSIALEVTKEWKMAEMLKEHNILTKEVLGGANCLVYNASSTPTSPLSPGPESQALVDEITSQLKAWHEAGKITFDSLLLAEKPKTAKPEEVKADKPKMDDQIYQDAISGKTIHEKHLEPVPNRVKNVYMEVIAAGLKGARAVLEKHGITQNNGKIYSLGPVGSKALPLPFATAAGRMIMGAENPGARLLLKLTHYALSTRDIYVGNKAALERMPTDPWLAAVNMICRQLPKHGLDDAVKVDGDYLPRAYAITTGAATVNTPGNKNPGKQNRRPQLPGVQDFQSRKKNFRPKPAGTYMTEDQLASFAQASVSAMINAQRGMAQPYPQGAHGYSPAGGADDWTRGESY